MPKFDLRTGAAGYWICAPYSHTDRRHMLTILSGPHLDEAQAREAHLSHSYGFICLLRPVPDLPSPHLSLEVIKAMVPQMAFVCVSWTPRAAKRFRIHSRRQVTLANAEAWSSTEIFQETNPRRRHYTLELLDGENTSISP